MVSNPTYDCYPHTSPNLIIFLIQTRKIMLNKMHISPISMKKGPSNLLVKQIPHTLETTVQLNNKWFTFSLSRPHRTHIPLTTCTPLCSKFSQVGIFLSMWRQENNWFEGRALRCLVLVFQATRCHYLSGLVKLT